MFDEKYMRIAIEEAKKGLGYTAPNPLVGAVIVKDNRIISTGYHKQYGGYHAERNAILTAGEDLTGAVLYVTLEPCCHQGKTPPCTQIILDSGISAVVIGSPDPNPLVHGKGILMLQEHGIQVKKDFLKAECDKLNPAFFHFIKHQTPYVIMKYAMTADGKISTATGASQWITGEKSRENVHRLRHTLSAIMVGVETVITDDPLLTCRYPDGKNPIRIICDTRLRTPINRRIIKTAEEVPTIIATAEKDPPRHDSYLRHNCKILVTNKKEGHLDLQDLMVKLGAMNIDSILLEGGSTLNFSAIEQGIVHKIQAYIAPKIFGGILAKSPIAGKGIGDIEQAVGLSQPEITVFDGDVLIQWEVLNHVYRNC